MGFFFLVFPHIPTDKPGATDEEIYDDVDSQTFHPPPPISRYILKHNITLVWNKDKNTNILLILCFYLAFHSRKPKAKLKRWTQKSWKSLRKRRRTSEKSLKSVSYMFFYLLISLFNCQNHICRNISKCDYTVY